MNATLIITILAAIGGPAGVVALIMVLPQIRKLQADTTAVEVTAELAGVEGAATLSNAALAQMAAAVVRATAAESKADAVALRFDDLEREFAEYKQLAAAVNEAHRAWDEDKIEKLVALGVPRESIEPPPSLLMLLGRHQDKAR